MKNLILTALFATLAGGPFAAAQEGSSDAQFVQASYTKTASYSPNEIKVMGTLDSGQTTRLAALTPTRQYRAYVFEGNGHDQVEITVSGANQKAYIALADATLTPIASGIGHLSAVLPYHGPDTEAFYILVKPTATQPARFLVHLNKVPAPAVQSADATR